MIKKDECLFTFNSTHAAISAESCLVGSHFSVRVMAKPDTLGAGCGLCLRLDVEKKEDACLLLNENQVPFEQVYLFRRTEMKTEYLPWKE